MSRRGAALLVLSVLALPGCATKPRTADPESFRGLAEQEWRPVDTTHTTAGISRLCTLPNSGLQLPSISPDGRRVAYLEVDTDQPVYPDALISGRGLEAVSLRLQELHDDQPAKLVCPGGVSWPTWSADGTTLAFVHRRPDGQCLLGLHEAGSDKTLRRALGLGDMMMPAISPAGRRVALSARTEPTGRWRLFLVDLETAAVEAAPDDGQGHQFWPFWLNERTIIYVACRDDGTYLSEWSPGQAGPRNIGRIEAPLPAEQALQLFAGLPAPLSPGGGKLAYYSIAADVITLIDLGEGSRRVLEPHTRAGCWLQDDLFVSATDDELLSRRWGEGESELLLRGAWLPRWGQADANRLILCTRGPEQRTFELLSVRFVPTPTR